jgi:hypothetical protein
VTAIQKIGGQIASASSLDSSMRLVIEDSDDHEAWLLNPSVLGLGDGAALAPAKLTLAAGATLTIASGVVTATHSRHAIDTEAAAASDDLDTISGGAAGQILIVSAANSSRDVVLKDATGNLVLASDCTLAHVNDRIVLISDGTNWAELCRSING